MGGFLLVAGLTMAVMVAGWMKLRPSPLERRRARVRAGAQQSGWRCRWMSPSEQAALGLTDETLCWYGRPVANETGALRVWVRRKDHGSWVQRGGEPAMGPPPGWLGPLPAGIAAVQVGQGVVALAWDELDPEVLATVLAQGAPFAS